MPDKQEIVLIRHGQSTANATGVWQGQLDFPLSDEGREQARRTAQPLSREKISGVYASPLARALETARIIASEVSFATEPISVPGLTERHGGVLEGTTPEVRESKHRDLMKKLNSLPEEEGWPLLGAETDEEVLIRFKDAVASIRAKHEPGDRILIVSHGGAMRAFLRDAFGPEILSGSERAPNASITRIAWEPGATGPKLLQLASISHLPTASAPGPDQPLQE